MTVGRLRSVAFECADPQPVAEFWAAVLGRPVKHRSDDWWSLEPAPDGARLAFQVVAGFEPPAWPGVHGEQQIHLDIEVDDIPSRATEVVELGARQLGDIVQEDDGAFQVFADPAGHPFCLVSTTD